MYNHFQIFIDIMRLQFGYSWQNQPDSFGPLGQQLLNQLPGLVTEFKNVYSCLPATLCNLSIEKSQLNGVHSFSMHMKASYTPGNNITDIFSETILGSGTQQEALLKYQAQGVDPYSISASRPYSAIIARYVDQKLITEFTCFPASLNSHLLFPDALTEGTYNYQPGFQEALTETCGTLLSNKITWARINMQFCADRKTAKHYFRATGLLRPANEPKTEVNEIIEPAIISFG
jgi:hypothetical protein